MNARLVLTVTAACAFALAACAGDPAVQRVERTVPAVATPSPWRLDFGDPVLAEILRRCDASALDVEHALAQFDRAEAEVEAAKSGLAPQAGLTALGAIGAAAGQSAVGAGAPTAYGAYEFDIWGRVRAGVAAATDDLSASRHDIDGARLLIAADVTRTYVAYRHAMATQALLQERLVVAQRLLELAQLQRDSGTATPSDVAEQRQGLADIGDALTKAGLEARIETVRLGELCGTTEPIEPANSNLLLRLVPVVDLSSESVLVRPDVQAAYARLSARNHRRAEAVAATRPRFVISASVGVADPGVLNLLDARSLAWALAGELTQTLADGGRRRADVHAAAAEAHLADIAYRKAVVSGWAQARQALARSKAAEIGLSEAEVGRRAEAVRSVQILRRREAGAADVIDVLVAQDRLRQRDIAKEDARFAALAARIDLELAAPGV